jgi:hypothetical protein
MAKVCDSITWPTASSGVLILSAIDSRLAAPWGNADYANLSNPSADCPVTFVITTNKPDVRDGSDVLRGREAYDDVDFSG